MIIYKATNKVNGKVYIGQTRHSLSWRKQKHFRSAKAGDDTHFHQAIRKYGEDAFEFSIICRAYSKEELNRLETYYINRYDSIRTGYNMIDGGDNNVMDIESVALHHKEVMMSKEVRNKISETMKAKIRRGELFTEDHRRKLSAAAKGNHNFGSGDTRSIGCYCVDSDGAEHHFHSYRDAWKWWKNVPNVFDTDAECVYQRKIKQSICKGYYTYGRTANQYQWPKWFKEEVISNEVTDKI